MTLRAVLFDLDGTLTTPGILDFDAIRSCLGCPKNRPILEFIASFRPSERKAALSVLEQFERKAADRAEANRGALEVLFHLKSHGIPFGLLTRNGSDSVIRTLARLPGITPRDFKAIVTRETAPPKPDPAGVFLAARRMGVLPSRILFVGDYRFDIIAGYRAGARTALVTNGRKISPLPEDPKPHFILENLTGIRPIVECIRPLYRQSPCILQDRTRIQTGQPAVPFE